MKLKRLSSETKEGLIKASNALYDPLNKSKKASTGENPD